MHQSRAGDAGLSTRKDSSGARAGRGNGEAGSVPTNSSFLRETEKESTAMNEQRERG